MDSNRIIRLAGILMFLGIGIWIVFVGFSAVQKENAKKNWTPTQAIIYKVYKENSSKQVGIGNVPQLKTGIRYKYKFNEQDYKGQTALSDGEARTYMKGDQITVRVNPADPAESDFDWVNHTAADLAQ